MSGENSIRSYFRTISSILKGYGSLSNNTKVCCFYLFVYLVGTKDWFYNTFGLIGGSIIPAPRCSLFFGRIGGSTIPAPRANCITLDGSALSTLVVLETVTVENADKASKDKANI